MLCQLHAAYPLLLDPLTRGPYDRRRDSRPGRESEAPKPFTSPSSSTNSVPSHGSAYPSSGSQGGNPKVEELRRQRQQSAVLRRQQQISENSTLAEYQAQEAKNLAEVQAIKNAAQLREIARNASTGWLSSIFSSLGLGLTKPQSSDEEERERLQKQTNDTIKLAALASKLRRAQESLAAHRNWMRGNSEHYGIALRKSLSAEMMLQAEEDERAAAAVREEAIRAHQARWKQKDEEDRKARAEAFARTSEANAARGRAQKEEEARRARAARAQKKAQSEEHEKGKCQHTGWWTQTNTASPTICKLCNTLSPYRDKSSRQPYHLRCPDCQQQACPKCVSTLKSRGRQHRRRHNQ